MNQTTKIIIAVIILAVLIGGGIYLWQQNSENKNTNTNNKVQNNSNTNQNGELKKVVVSKENFIRDEYDFNSAEIEEDILKLDITYSGGCEDHTFNLVWSGDFLETSPVQADLLLSHDSQDDACEAAIKNTLQFDLTPLKEAYEDSYGKVENIICGSWLGAARPSPISRRKSSKINQGIDGTSDIPKRYMTYFSEKF